MALDGAQGPLAMFGASNLGGDNNPDRSLSLFDQGCGILDPRTPYHFEAGRQYAVGWFGQGRMSICDQIPSTASLTAIAGSQAPTGGTPLTLVSSSGGGVTVGQSITRADTGALVTGLLVIDGANPPIQNGQINGNQFWDPTKSIARCLQIHSAGDDHLGYVMARGFDIYDFPLTEKITLTDAGTAVGKKAFKYVYSLTPGGTLSGSNIECGQADTFGFMLRADRFQYLDIWWPDTTLVASPTGFTAAVTSTPSATTGDVRGTYALQSASNNAERLVMYLQIPPSNIGSAAGLVGPTQYADF
jgi:hypothetical protein